MAGMYAESGTRGTRTSGRRPRWAPCATAGLA